MGEPVSEPQFVLRHITSVDVTHVGGAFAYEAVQERGDTVIRTGDTIYITTKTWAGDIYEEIEINVKNCIAISVARFVQRYQIKPERKAEQAAARAARNEPLGGIDRSIS